MAGKSLFVLGLVILVLTSCADVVNYKKDYCGNEEYVGNNGNKYPHLHCGRNFLTLSRSKTNHNNLQGKCNKVEEILADPDYYYGSAANSTAITIVLTKYQEKGCPNQLESDEL